MHKLEIDSVELSFGFRKILSDIYMKCETGKITGLLGRNGQGKTCLMNIICGSLPTVSKSIRFDEKTVFNAYQKPDLLLYLPQFNFIPKGLTVKRVLNDCHIDFSSLKILFPDFESKYLSKINSLSVGQRRIMELFIIIKSKAQFILLDEPFSQIMPLHIQKIKELLIEEKQNKGILLTDHMYKHVTDISDDLYVLSAGKTHLTKDISDIEKLGYAKF